MAGPGEGAASNRTAHLIMAALPYVMIAMVTAVELMPGTELGFLSLLALGPAFASLVGTVRRTAVIGAIALMLSLVLGAYDDLIGTRQSFQSLLVITGVTAASLVATVGRQRRERELANVRSVAEVAQRVLMRPVPRRAGHLRIAVSYTSAAADAHIGGDLYDVVTGSAGVRVIVGDVQGKGLEAVDTAALVLSVFREAAHDEPDLLGVSSRLEKALNRRLEGEDFVTAVLLEATGVGAMTLLNYGHPAPLILHADGRVSFAEPEETAPPLGMGTLDVEGPVPHRIRFRPGDQMLLYTDGVIEARDPEGRFYPLAERAFLLKNDNPEAALEALRLDLVAHVAAPLHDDAAMLLLRQSGGRDLMRLGRTAAPLLG
ncbi:PP2C family protein-serine/threonine phosphatase [Nonomuraea sp. NPDC059194]|uniref:PP2C family protein-serine/threonine phosphatase n=1 Tax=Nonomuraea sp. NPDC059194 TaxID=3346764 RepID=UPI0036961F2B